MSDLRDHKEDKKPNFYSTHITLKVTNQDGHAMFFRNKKNGQLEELMSWYCLKMKLEFHSVRFFFDGTRIRPNHTPEELKMEDGDEIDTVIEQRGGWGLEKSLVLRRKIISFVCLFVNLLMGT
ncbi:Rad60/SUMO-like domain containing protein [Parasponia andersonii]|uniref:Rad60/SUMO-like domain containing protein n=1 Tax=Parasponia andersonii TaxID=3476 RepID=A0A2P5AX87_PARAD|nr:Rad60/SUMO-like domain containing protein [Parasponia andersonii]